MGEVTISSVASSIKAGIMNIAESAVPVVCACAVEPRIRIRNVFFCACSMNTGREETAVEAVVGGVTLKLEYVMITFFYKNSVFFAEAEYS